MIARDSSNSVTLGSAPWQVTLTASGSNRIAFVGVLTNAARTITGITYDGAAMTFIVKEDTNHKKELWYIINPSTTTNAIVAVTFDSTPSYADIFVASYTGVNQSLTYTGTPTDNSTSGAYAGNGLTLTVTTILDNSWAVLLGEIGGTALPPLASTNATLVTTPSDGDALFDNYDYGAITPVGDFSMRIIWNTGGSSFTNGIMASFSPAASSLSISVADTVTIAESIGRMMDLNPKVIDTVTITESLTVDLPIIISVFESILVTESISITNTNLGAVSVSDAVSIGESVTPSNPNLGGISVFESVTVTESISRNLSIEISVLESVNISETIGRELNINISVFDSVSASDILTVTISALKKGWVKMRSTGQSYPVGLNESNLDPMRSSQQNRPIALDDSKTL